MKTLIYIPVKVENELPKKYGYYHTNIGKCVFHNLGRYWTFNSGTVAPVEWLKPVEMPSEEQIVDILVEDIGPTEEEMQFINDEGFFMYNKRILNITKAIMALMKGER